MEERTEWPTGSFLQELREKGVFPYSFFCTSAAGLAAFVGILWLQRNSFVEAFELLRASGDPAATGVAFLSKVVGLFVYPTIGLIFASLLCGFLQTRFWFTGVSLDLRRLLPGSRKEGRPGSVGQSARLFLVLTVSILLGWYCTGEFLKMIGSGQESFGFLPRMVQELFPAFFGGLALLSILARLWTEISFRYTHRMTRKELEAEIRER